MGTLSIAHEGFLFESRFLRSRGCSFYMDKLSSASSIGNCPTSSHRIGRSSFSGPSLFATGRTTGAPHGVVLPKRAEARRYPRA